MDVEWVPLPRIPQTPILEDWLEEVAKYLPTRSIRRDAVSWLLEEHRGVLVEKFNAGATAKDAGDALVARLG